MFFLNEENKIAVVTCTEVVLMRGGNANYNLVLAKLRSIYNCEIGECIDRPEYLRTVLKEVYKDDYNSVLDKIRLETDRLTDMDEFKDKFFKIMTSYPAPNL